MDFADTAPEAAFRAQVRAWLEANATRRTSAAQRFGDGLERDAHIAAAKDWQRRKAAAGYVAITKPRDQGGMGGTAAQQIIYLQEEAAYLTPAAMFGVSLGMAVPTVAMWAAPQIAARFVARGLAGEDIWCQLFSEPSAGSDIANIRCRAERDGDDWIVNGQKVWTSGAQFSDFGILLVRTDWDKPKQKGLTMFILDMRAGGVDVRPIRSAAGDEQFNEVFLNDVRIPDAWRLGGEGDGWTVMLSTLMQERMSVGGDLALPTYRELIASAKNCHSDDGLAIEDARVREHIADAYLDQFGLELIIRRACGAMAQGQAPGPDMALVKLVGARNIQKVGRLAIDLAGADGLLDDAAPGYSWRTAQHMWISGAGARLAGGTEEILRNVIAERVLGLPGEPRTDRDQPFRDLPV